jgi:hypothetical protein
MEHVVAAGLEPATKQVLEQKGPEISDVGVVVDGGPAGVERYAAGLERRKLLNLT